MELVRGEKIRQDKMLQAVKPLAELISEISRSNAESKSLVKLAGQIHGSNYWSNCSVKSAGQICRSNSWFKSIGQIAAHVTPDVTPVTRNVTEKHARKRSQFAAITVQA